MQSENWQLFNISIFFKRVHFEIKYNHANKLKYHYESPIGMQCEIESSSYPTHYYQDRLICEWLPESFNWDMQQTSFCFIAYGTVLKINHYFK